MKYILKPTLEHIALVKITVSLWNMPDIRTLLEEFSNTRVFLQADDNFPLRTKTKYVKDAKWQAIETRVEDKVSQLILETSLKEKILSYIKPIGLQVLRWMEYHYKCFCLDLKLPNEFCWTPLGAIDKKKTTKILIEDDGIDITIRYKLACIYCLEDDIPELWNKIPESLKITSDHIEDPREISEMAILDLWKGFEKGKVHWKNKLIKIKPCITSYKIALRSAASMANKAAIQYFLSKISTRKRSLVKTAVYVANAYHKIDPTVSDPPREYYTEALCFLLSEMNNRKQLRMFERYTSAVLFPLFDWPWQGFIVKTMNRVREFFNVNLLFGVAIAIARKVGFGYKDYNYQKMYTEIWQQLPNDKKSFVFNDSGLAGIIVNLLEYKDRENIKLMLQDASVAERKELIFRNTAFAICRAMAQKEEWDLIKFFVQLCITSKDEMIKFKERVTEHAERLSQNDKWDEFMQLLNDLIRGYDKRKSVEEGECSTAKKLCDSDST